VPARKGFAGSALENPHAGMGATINKSTESLNLILKQLKYVQGEETIVVCAMI